MLIDNALADFGQTLSWTFEIRNATTILGIVQAGLGIAVLPVSVLPQREGAGIIYRELDDPPIRRSIGIVTRKTVGHPAAVQSFLDVLTDIAREL